MAIEELAINNFRNILHAQIYPSTHTNFIIGKNGSGKTSLLEAIYYLGTGRSFRTPQSKILINFNADSFTLFSKIQRNGVEVGLGISRDKSSIKIRIANESVSNASRLAELIPVQLINPDVHKLMEEGPRFRRRFIEWGVFHVKHQYHSLWQQCTHILRQRNAALRMTASEMELAYWDEALNEISEQITKLRWNYLESLEPIYKELISRVPGLPKISITLKTGWDSKKSLRDALKETREQDRKKGFTQCGPHRADLKFTCGQTPAKEIISRGQQKMIAALLKLAQVTCLCRENINARPVILVDDLPAELDQEFRDILIKEVTTHPAQSFITATNVITPTIALTDSTNKMFHVEHGQIIE